MSVAEGHLPTIAVAMGDPAGISPELLARLLAEPDIRPLARFVIFGDARVLDMGAKVAKTNPDVARATSESALPADRSKPILVDLANCDLGGVTIAKATLAGGNFATENFRRALRYAASGGRGRGLLHALQQGGDALRLSGLRRRDPLRARRHRVERAGK